MTCLNSLLRPLGSENLSNIDLSDYFGTQNNCCTYMDLYGNKFRKNVCSICSLSTTSGGLFVC